MKILGWAVLEGEDEPVRLLQDGSARFVHYPAGVPIYTECEDFAHFLRKLDAQGFTVLRSGVGIP